jgi:hypothetical protein
MCTTIRLLLSAATLAAILVACSKDPLAPTRVSVFYANRSTHFQTGEPGTAIITWLSPGTVSEQRTETTPSGAFTWYGPGFRTDTVLPNQVTCQYFEAPGDQIAVQIRMSLPGGTGVGYASRAGGAITWHSETSWGFTGDRVGPAGGSDGYGGVVQGC